VLGYGVGSSDGGCSTRVFGCVRVLGRSSNDIRGSSSSSSVRVLDGFVDDRMDLACRRLGCGGERRVMS
jgi:hypothetical protein